jgi:amidohydrolase
MAQAAAKAKGRGEGMVRRSRRLEAILVLAVCASARAAEPAARSSISDAEVDAVYPELEKVYVDLHRNPELSGRETGTAAKLAEGLRQLGFEVTTGVGGTGVVGVLRNGAGPVAMLRTEMDALPVEEHTGLPYASRVKATNDLGQEVSVMHACGHDLHMSAWLGTARLMAAARSRWSGTLVLIGQPAEETVGGAAPMLKDGLFTRFPKPDFVLAIHDQSGLPTGTMETAAGYVTSNADSVDITIRGRGGHGAKPQTTVDPVVIAARVVLTLQTLISRENDPRNPAVITVGSIHGGTKHNIIPDEVKLQLTVRSYSEEVRAHLLEGIRRIAKAEAEAAAAPEPPVVAVSDDRAYGIYNDPDLVARVTAAVGKRMGADRVKPMLPQMFSEDFSEYGRAGAPIAMLFVGASDPAACEAAKKSGAALPQLHSSNFAPDLPGTLKTAMVVETTALLCVLGPGK